MAKTIASRAIGIHTDWRNGQQSSVSFSSSRVMIITQTAQLTQDEFARVSGRTRYTVAWISRNYATAVRWDARYDQVLRALSLRRSLISSSIGVGLLAGEGEVSGSP
jgi:uncharacterized DUF497 family protein